MTGVWSNDQTAMLIELYQSETVLYNARHTNYHNKYERTRALENIVAGLQNIRANTKVIELKAKINALRARFNAELTKLRDKPNGSCSEVTKVSFKFFEKLMFLQNHLNSRKSYSNLAHLDKPSTSCQSWTGMIEDEDEEELNSQQNFNFTIQKEEPEETVTESDNILSPYGSLRLSTAPSSPISEERPKKHIKITDNGEASNNFLVEATSTLTKNNDEWEVFGKFLVSSIRRLGSNQAKLRCKHRLLKVLIECEEEGLDR